MDAKRTNAVHRQQGLPGRWLHVRLHQRSRGRVSGVVVVVQQAAERPAVALREPANRHAAGPRRLLVRQQELLPERQLGRERLLQAATHPQQRGRRRLRQEGLQPRRLREQGLVS